MKMTKIIREYIADEVNKKYKSAIEKSEKELRDANKELEDIKVQGIEMFSKMVSEYYNEKILPLYEDGKPCTPKDISIGFPYRYGYGHETKKQEIARQKHEHIIAKCNNDIKAVMIELELGGTKADLDRLLSSINPDAEE